MLAKRLGQEYIDSDRRDTILGSIREIRGIASGLDERASAIPEIGSPTGPLGADAQVYKDVLQKRARMEPLVLAVEQKLSGPGPVWNIAPGDPKTILDYVAVVDQQAAILDKHVPTQASKDAQKLVLLAVGVVAIFAPLLWETGKGWAFPPVPESVKPTPAQIIDRTYQESARAVQVPVRPGEPVRTGPSTFRSPHHGTYSVRRPS